MFYSTALLSALVGTVAAGNILWDGRFNDLTSSADLEKWSWSNQVGPYQYYIHGSGTVDKYVNLSPDFKNPADTGSTKGVKLTIDDTAHWNGQPMFRTELIPQTKAAINTGKVYYHFSISTKATNPPSPTEEHQIAFFESHFVEMMYGQNGGNNNTLRFATNGQAQWAAELKAGEWHNVAYEIDFSAKTVAFYHSTGNADLALKAGPLSASTSSNGQDFHLGVLRLPGTGAGTTEDWFFSGVYVESGPLNTKVASPGGSASDSPASTPQLPVASAPAPSTLQTSISQAPSLPTGGYGQAPSSTSEPAPTGSVITTLPFLEGPALVAPISVVTAKTYMDALTSAYSQTSAQVTDGLSVTDKTSVAPSTLPAPDTPAPTPSGYESRPASVPASTPTGYDSAPAPEVPTTTATPFPQPSSQPLPTDSIVPTYSSVPLEPITTLSSFEGPALTQISSVASAISSDFASITASLSISISAPSAGYDEPAEPTPTEGSPLPSDAPKPSSPISDVLPEPSNTPCTTTQTYTATRPAATGGVTGPIGGIPAPTGAIPFPTGGYGTGTRSPARPTGRHGHRHRKPWWYRSRKGRTGPDSFKDSESYAALLQRLAEMNIDN
ncbi:Histone transcription regulator 3 [Elsinoe australis]|uniref:Histone transcription regulator 3 n=1 Tax=Elsinoe australis TaxID=40998 RepID=A0A2P7ZDF9_9PEZI|nr:Histone transcription regulator 3 [Elsinoe australis]